MVKDDKLRNQGVEYQGAFPSVVLGTRSGSAEPCSLGDEACMAKSRIVG